jgi:hypothetical protein
MEEAAFAISVMFKAREICIGYSIFVLLFLNYLHGGKCLLRNLSDVRLARLSFGGLY